MSNLKYIYLKKIHKVPSNVKNFYNLVETIKNTYKQLDNIYLFAIINPDNPEAVTQINSDVTFQQIKIFYHQQGWSSLKLLVTESQNYQESLKDSWNLLNQSVVTTEKKYHDASTLFQPDVQDQQQQLVPLFQNISTQTKVKQIDNAQNTSKFDYRNNQQLKQLIDEIIDLKLKELGLLKDSEVKVDPSDYKFCLQQKLRKLTAIPNKNLNINIALMNNGNKRWNNPVIVNKGLKMSKKFVSLDPGQGGSVAISIPYVAQHFKNSPQYCYRFDIFVENEQGKVCQVYGQIPIILMAPSLNDLKEDKIIRLLEVFPQKGEKVIRKLVEESEVDKSDAELIEQLLLENL